MPGQSPKRRRPDNNADKETLSLSLSRKLNPASILPRH